MSELEGANETDSPAVKTEMSTKEVEKLEEAKLKAKYPLGNKPLSGHSAFLQKRLAKGQKFFDSGDYNMARQKPPPPRTTPPTIPAYGTGETIPTPETVPVRKTSIIQPKYPSTAT